MAKEIMEKRTNRKRAPACTVGVENKQPPRDNLDLDVMDAERAGVSYGKYKALHPNTRDKNEPRLATKPKREPKQPKVYEFACRNCGEKFTTTNTLRRYCCDACKHQKNNANYYAKPGKKKKEV